MTEYYVVEICGIFFAIVTIILALPEFVLNIFIN